MAQTFYIKSAGFDENSTDVQEREDNSFIIGPGELDGPGGVNRNTDLYLYGFGAIKWGTGVDQNLFRLLENNACPEKSGSPGIPVDDSDYGLGNGITNPVIGQTWFNKTDGELWMYGSAGSPFTWSLVTATSDATSAAALAAHAADMDLHLTVDQNTFLDTLDLPTLTSTEVNYLIGVTSLIQPQIDAMVAEAGDTMTGDLIMSADIVLDDSSELLLDFGNSRINTHDGNGDFNIRLGNYYSAADLYSEAGIGAITITADNSVVSPTLTIRVGEASAAAVADQPVVYTGTTTFKNDGNVTVSAPAPLVGADLANKDYVDAEITNATLGTTPIGGIIMFSGTIASLPVNWKICDGANGTPNLIDKFIRATNLQANIGNTGGFADATLVTHDHDRGNYEITGTIKNAGNVGMVNSGADVAGCFQLSGPVDLARGLQSGNNGEWEVAFKASNTWIGRSGSEGVSATGKNLPPFYTLAFIQRKS